MTPDVVNALERAFTGGASINDACDYVGINRGTYFNWMAIGRALTEPEEVRTDIALPAKAKRERYIDFYNRMKKARVVMRIEAVALIRLAAGTNWQAAAWLLERSDPENWARRDRDGDMGQAEVVVRVIREDMQL
jgi:hypothetical protein